VFIKKEQRMLINSISFAGYAKKADKQEHKKLDQIAETYTTKSPQDRNLTKLAHDVFEITPWQCSEGSMLEIEDRKTGNEFMAALRKGLEEGNSKLAYALGRAVLHSPAGRADNCDFEDLPLGEIGKLDNTLYAFSTTKDAITGVRKIRPECVAINRTVDSII
jgi:hypothetical protein